MTLEYSPLAGSCTPTFPLSSAVAEKVKFMMVYEPVTLTVGEDTKQDVDKKRAYLT